jgi:hypothetical protein
MKALLIEYGQKSTIAGLHYAFKQKQSMIGRVIWMISLAILTFLGFWLSLKNYEQWKEEPVLTTITTTGSLLIEQNFSYIELSIMLLSI